MVVIIGDGDVEDALLRAASQGSQSEISYSPLTAWGLAKGASEGLIGQWTTLELVLPFPSLLRFKAPGHPIPSSTMAGHSS